MLPKRVAGDESLLKNIDTLNLALKNISGIIKSETELDLVEKHIAYMFKKAREEINE